MPHTTQWIVSSKQITPCLATNSGSKRFRMSFLLGLVHYLEVPTPSICKLFYVLESTKTKAIMGEVLTEHF